MKFTGQAPRGEPAGVSQVQLEFCVTAQELLGGKHGSGHNPDVWQGCTWKGLKCQAEAPGFCPQEMGSIEGF